MLFSVAATGKKTLLPKLKELRGKKLLLLLDADAAGKKSANKLLAELLARGCLAVTKYLYDALYKDEQNYFGWKVDANSILAMRSYEYLKQILRKIIVNAEPDFKALEERIAQQNLFMQEQAAQCSPELSLPN